MKWSKLLANLVGNATSAIVGRPPAIVYADPLVFEIERRQLREALAVIRRSGLRIVALPGRDVRLLDLATRLPASRSPGRSCPGRRRRARRQGAVAPAPPRRPARSASEVEWLNGAVARAATDLGGVAPVNRRLAELVAEVLADERRRAWFDGRTDRLAAEVGVAG